MEAGSGVWMHGLGNVFSRIGVFRFLTFFFFFLGKSDRINYLIN